jgi:hypothetical protein
MLAVLLAAAASALMIGRWRWRRDTAEAVGELWEARPGPPPGRFAISDLAGLPPPVGRYFRAVLHEGQPSVRWARLTQEGQFLIQPAKGTWAPFEATQHLRAKPPGFVWDARIRMAPGLAVYVRDALIEGQGLMLGKAAGLFTVVRMENDPGISAGALHRYLAEAVWCPTMLLPAAGVVWTPVDDSTARASLTAGATTVTLDFHFGPDSLVRSIYTPERQYQKDGRTIPMPWQGRWTEWGERNGVRIPIAGEVEWLLPGGPQPYWRGRILELLVDDQGAR